MRGVWSHFFWDVHVVEWTIKESWTRCEIWSLNGKTTRIVSSVSWDGDKGCSRSQTFESTKRLMVELTRCLGHLNRENTVFKRSHSSEKCVQDEDKRCARPRIVLSKPFLYRLSTWLWKCKSRPELVGFTYTFVSICGDRFRRAFHCIRFPSWILRRNVFC